MPVQINCPACATALRVPEDLLGQQVRCSGCQNIFTAQAPPETPPGPVTTTPESTPSKAVDKDVLIQTEPAEPSRRPDQDADEDSPRSRRRNDDEDEDYPRYRGEDDLRSYGRPHRGSVVLILGIIGLVFAAIGACIMPYFIEPVAFGLSLAAWIIGRIDLRAMDKGEMDPRGRDQTKSGWICGIIGTCLSALVVFIMCGVVLFFVVVAYTTK